MMNICDREKCVGCFACANVCPKNCIETAEDTLGHIYPKINNDLCIECGKCRKVCPVNNNPAENSAKSVYACWSNDANERASSTLGGAATIISRYIIKNGGVVYGSAYTNGKIQHIRVDNLDDLQMLKGSKYVHSHMTDIYTDLQNDIKTDRTVLFIGTPCQCAGIVNFVGDKRKNLYVIDLICTGVPSQKLMWEHLSDKGIPDHIRFRDECGTRFTLTKNNKIIYQKPLYADYFLMGFAKHLHLRDSCYICPYALYERCSDITLGDFWGLGKNTPFKHSQKGGVSELFVNSEKGQMIFDAVKDEMFTEKREISEALESNPRYYSPSEPNKNRDKFVRLYEKYGFKKAAKKAMVKARFRYFVFRRLRSIKRLFKI